jgi:hypothetical protein
VKDIYIYIYEGNEGGIKKEIKKLLKQKINYWEKEELIPSRV